MIFRKQPSCKGLTFKLNPAASFNGHEILELEDETEDFLQDLWADIAKPVGTAVSLAEHSEESRELHKRFWVPVARSSGLVLLRELVERHADQPLSPGDWTEATLTGLDYERFRRVTGLTAEVEIHTAIEQAALSITNSKLLREPGKGLALMGHYGVLGAADHVALN